MFLLHPNLSLCNGRLHRLKDPDTDQRVNGMGQQQNGLGPTVVNEQNMGPATSKETREVRIKNKPTCTRITLSLCPNCVLITVKE